MRNLVKYVGIGLLVMGLAACDDKDTNATAQGSVAESNATGNPVNLLDGKLSFSLPADMTDQSGKLGTQANNMHVWSDATGQKAVIVIMGDDPKEDLAVLADFDTHVLPELERNIAQYDRLYLTIDLDVLPAREMPAVSAPAALGVPLAILLRIVELLCRSGKLQAVDLVEFNPQFDIDGQGARAAARLAWQIAHWWR